MIDPPAEAVRLDPAKYRYWLEQQDVNDLADLAAAGLVATDAFPGPPAPAGGLAPPNRIRQDVDAILRYRADQANASAYAALPVAIVHILPGVDDVAAAMASLPRRTVARYPNPEDAEIGPDGAVVLVDTEVDPEWELHGDALFVVGVGEAHVRQALIATRT